MNPQGERRYSRCDEVRSRVEPLWFDMGGPLACGPCAEILDNDPSLQRQCQALLVDLRVPRPFEEHNALHKASGAALREVIHSIASEYRGPARSRVRS